MRLKTKGLLLNCLLISIVLVIMVSPMLLLTLFFFVSDIADSIPNQKKFPREIQKIDGIAIWEMKNLAYYKNRDTPQFFFMLERVPQNICPVIGEYYNANKERIKKEVLMRALENGIRLEFYKKSKKLPKYFVEEFGGKWIMRDLIQDHEEDLIAVLELDNNLNIKKIEINTDFRH